MHVCYISINKTTKKLRIVPKIVKFFVILAFFKNYYKVVVVGLQHIALTALLSNKLEHPLTIKENLHVIYSLRETIKWLHISTAFVRYGRLSSSFSLRLSYAISLTVL